MKKINLSKVDEVFKKHKEDIKNGVDFVDKQSTKPKNEEDFIKYKIIEHVLLNLGNKKDKTWVDEFISGDGIFKRKILRFRYDLLTIDDLKKAFVKLISEEDFDDLAYINKIKFKKK